MSAQTNKAATRMRASGTLVVVALILTAGIVGIADSARRASRTPLPIGAGRPGVSPAVSVRPYVGKRVALVGTLQSLGPHRAVLVQPSDPNTGWPTPWFSDVTGSATVSPALMPADMTDGTTIVTGILSAVPDPESPGKWSVAVAADNLGTANAWQAWRQRLDEAGYLACILGLLFLPLWVRIGLACRPGRKDSDPRRHCCPTCGYDLRATPRRCPECNALVESPWDLPKLTTDLSVIADHPAWAAANRSAVNAASADGNGSTPR